MLLVRTSISLEMFCFHHLPEITLFDAVFHSRTYTLSFISISWYLYSFIPDVMKKSAIFIDPVIFQVCDDDVSLRIATKTVRLEDSVSWDSLIREQNMPSASMTTTVPTLDWDRFLNPMVYYWHILSRVKCLLVNSNKKI